MRDILNIIFISFLLFNSILPNIFILPSAYSYWDEGVSIGLFFLFLIVKMRETMISKTKLNKENLIFILPWLGVVLIGLIGNLFFGYTHYYEAIIRDIVGFLKFPMTIYVIRELKLDEIWARSLYRTKLWWLKILTFIMFVCSIISLFSDIGMSQNSDIRYGIVPFQFLYSHPTALVVFSICMICIFRAYNCFNIYENLLLIVIALTMRTKGFAFIAVYIFLKYGGHWIKRWKVLYWTSIFVTVLIMGYQKLSLYASYSSSGREVLWKGSIWLLRRCFPIGSGFATYASHISGKYRSTIYNFIYSSDFFGSDGKATAVLGDTGFPYYIGQFGLLGVALLTISTLYLRKQLKENIKSTFYVTDVVLIYIAIALTSEAILINYGVELAIILCIVKNIQLLQEKSVFFSEKNGNDI